MITVYSKPLCGYCDMAKNWLTKHGFQWAEVRIDMNPEAREFLLKEGDCTMRQIYHNG